MANYEQRKEIAKEIINKSDEEGLDLYKKLYLSGVSLRIIEDLTGVKRSKLQRFFTENKIKREDINTRRKDNNISLTKELYEDGYSIDEIAEKIERNPRTVERYLKELGFFSETNFKW